MCQSQTIDAGRWRCPPQDSRGFLFGPLLAIKLGCRFAPVRKAGKLPGEKRIVKYEKEYGTVRGESLDSRCRWTIHIVPAVLRRVWHSRSSLMYVSVCAVVARALSLQDSFEMMAYSVKRGDRVIIVDDLLATGALPCLRPQLTSCEVVFGAQMCCLVWCAVHDRRLAEGCSGAGSGLPRRSPGVSRGG